LPQKIESATAEKRKLAAHSLVELIDALNEAGSVELQEINDAIAAAEDFCTEARERIAKAGAGA
jgi:hypothetical protein